MRPKRDSMYFVPRIMQRKGNNRKQSHCQQTQQRKGIDSKQKGTRGGRSFEVGQTDPTARGALSMG